MVLGTKRRKLCSAAISRMLCNPRNSKQCYQTCRAELHAAARSNEQLVKQTVLSKQAASTSNVDRSGQRDVGFPDGTEQRAVVKEPRNPVVHNNLTEVFVVQDVRVDERS